MLDNDVFPYTMTCCLFTKDFVCTPSGVSENTAMHNALIVNTPMSVMTSLLVHREHCRDYKKSFTD